MQTHFIKSYWRVWLTLTQQQFQQQIVNARGAAILFIFGKLFRLATAFLLLYVVVGKAKFIAGYSLNQAVFLLVLFNLIQTITQLLLRGVYIFRQKVVDGTFDFYLLNPLSELFYSLFSYTDPMDVIALVPYLIFTFWSWTTTGFPITLISLLSILLIVILCVIMVTSWHIAIISIGVRYLEVDNTVMLYRDIERMAAFPVGIYGKWGSIFLTYIFPFALMSTIPANIVFGLTSPVYLLLFAALAILQLKLALMFWHHSLLHYSSASS